jgi:hypothetical protein
MHSRKKRYSLYIAIDTALFLLLKVHKFRLKDFLAK